MNWKLDNICLFFNFNFCSLEMQKMFKENVNLAWLGIKNILPYGKIEINHPGKFYF